MDINPSNENTTAVTTTTASTLPHQTTSVQSPVIEDSTDGVIVSIPLMSQLLHDWLLGSTTQQLSCSVFGKYCTRLNGRAKVGYINPCTGAMTTV